MSEENQDTKDGRPQLIKLVDSLVKFCGMAGLHMMEALRDGTVTTSTQGLITNAVNAASAGDWKRAVHLANDVSNVESIACTQFAENMHKAKIFHDEIHVWLDDEAAQKKKDLEWARNSRARSFGDGGEKKGQEPQEKAPDTSEYVVDSIPCEKEGFIYADTSFGPVEIPEGYQLQRKSYQRWGCTVHIESGWRSESNQHPKEVACIARTRAEAFAESPEMPQLPEDWRLDNEDEESISAVREGPYCLATVSAGVLANFPNLIVIGLPDEPVPKIPIAVADALFARWRSR